MAESQIINLDGPVSPAVLAGILGCNVSLIYQEAQVGRLPTDVKSATYRECLQMYIKHFKKNQDLRILKEQNEARIKEKRLADSLELKKAKYEASEESNKGKASDGMNKLLEAKYVQEIRLSRARETQLWIKSSADRGEYISVEELSELIEPFVLTIKQGLVSLALSFPEVESKVDTIMEELYHLGSKLVETSERDVKTFLDEVMGQDISLEDITIDDEPPTLL